MFSIAADTDTITVSLKHIQVNLIRTDFSAQNWTLDAYDNKICS